MEKVDWEYVYIDNFTVHNKSHTASGQFIAAHYNGETFLYADTLEEMVQKIVDSKD